MVAKPTVFMPPPEALSGIDPAAAGLATRSAEILSRVGDLTLADVDDFPSKDELITCFGLVQGPSVLTAHRDIIGTWPDQRDRYPEYIVRRLTVSEQRSDAELHLGRELQAQIRSRLDRILTESVVVLPVTGCAPPLTTEPEVAVIEGVRLDLRSVVLPNTVAPNVAGLPAVAVPASVDGVNYGIQLVGPRGSDLTLLELAQCLVGDPAEHN
jgi:Asp-tRNA(Asn)/Glu-tRNA(Gln) amidotransferase A subunit family amidase